MCGNALWWLVIAAALFHELAGEDELASTPQSPEDYL